MIQDAPSLFGLNNSNRDFSTRNAWGKNQFNSSFPAALCCYLASKQIEAVYLSIQDKKFAHDMISIDHIFGISAQSDDLYFAFEAQHTPYQKYLVGTLPRTDLVTQRKSTGQCLRGLEIKLTALPDNTTCDLPENQYGCEIVVRPDTLFYLACSLYQNSPSEVHENICDLKINDWSNPSEVLSHIQAITSALGKLAVDVGHQQTPFLVQPIWKTVGKSPVLSDQCLDIFVWSDAGFCHLISRIATSTMQAESITRPTRTAIWLFKILVDIAYGGKCNYKQIINDLAYNTKNDKAFASSGQVTHPYMACARLQRPIIAKSEIKNIILNGGEKLLSPERRFDAIVYSSPDLFQ